MNIRVIIIQWRIQTIILMSLAFMWLWPYGSFDPTTLGFYLSIALACFIEFTLSKILKFPKSEDTSKNLNKGM